MSAIHEHVLQNGMTLLCWPQRHLHGLEFGLYLKGGPLYETEETQGISNLLEHLCFRGLGGLNREGLLRELNRFGTNLDAATYAEGLVFRLKCLPRFFDAALEYFLRFFANVPWTPEQIAAEKQVVLRQLEADGDGDLFDRAACDFRKTENGAFPPLGTPESLTALTEADIQLWQEMIFQPQNACLVMTGNFSDGMELAAIEALSELRNTTAQPPRQNENMPSDKTISQKWTHSATQVSAMSTPMPCSRLCFVIFFFTISGMMRLMSGKKSFQRFMPSFS